MKPRPKDILNKILDKLKMEGIKFIQNFIKIKGIVKRFTSI